METGNITLLFRKIHELELNQGIIMEAENQSVAIVKREDKKGIYYSINDIINNIPQKPYNDECAMVLILLNQKRFIHKQYNSRISQFQ